MVSASTANSVMNLGMHMWVWYAALTWFFYKNVSKSHKGGKVEYDTMAATAATDFLDDAKAVGATRQEWVFVDSTANRRFKEVKEGKQNVKSHNEYILYANIALLSVGLCALIGLYFYFSSKGIKLDMKHLIIENIVVLVVMFSLEMSFLTKTYPKFISNTQKFVNDTAIDRLKSKLKSKIEES